MKPIYALFAFFLITVTIAFTNVESAFGQQVSDSLNYYKTLALKPQNATDLIKSENYFNKNYEKVVKTGDINIAIRYLYYMASIAYKKGEYIKSEEMAVKALNHLDTLKSSNYTISTRKSFYNLLGLMYSEQQNQQKAIELYSNALKISESPSDSAKIYNNLSVVYKAFDDLDNAQKEIRKAYNLIPRITDTITQALIIDNYGVIESKISTANGINAMNKALELRESVNDTSTIYTSYAHLAEYYYRLNNVEESKKYALKSLELAEIINSDAYKNDALGLLVDVSDDAYARAYKKLNDSLYASEKESLNTFALLKYDNSEYKRKALQSQLEKEQQESRTVYAILIASFIALGSIFIYFILKAKHKKENLQQVFDTESRISKQIHDEVANGVFQVMSKLENQEVKNEVLLNDLHDLYYKTRDISKKHSDLSTEYPFKDHLDELIESFNDNATSVIIKGMSEVSWDHVPQLKRVAIYRVLQELLINMKKHSFASLVVIMFKKENNKIRINYSDNGVGSELKKGVGLQNTENRIQSINGSITFETNPNKGFKVKITI
ncbi:tetratricopeptide repeat-containing sensor histidine kinase [Winogradskyella psychrotolerans]|uniref:tetratricopeptide repeat-containing sensor histidine kinase n=1 Tax=Winogradskyella psychrotolerans TaxID=1344585 RepID=UPI001C064C8C|nr:tetratricopeptide repeat protein [Winogradskyella psychrotolerans]MBU2929417.1 hypothetical protein [Winogradskyella psychrotolerans]